MQNKRDIDRRGDLTDPLKVKLRRELIIAVRIADRDRQRVNSCAADEIRCLIDLCVVIARLRKLSGAFVNLSVRSSPLKRNSNLRKRRRWQAGWIH